MERAARVTEGNRGFGLELLAAPPPDGPDGGLFRDRGPIPW